MKKVTILIIPILSILFLFSCKKSGVSPVAPSGNSLLIGKWYYSKDTITEYKNGTLSFINPTGGITFNSSAYEIFNSNGTGAQAFGSSITNFTYTISGNAVSTNESGTIEKGIIKNLTANQLELYYDDTTTDGNGNKIRDTEAAYFSK